VVSVYVVGVGFGFVAVTLTSTAAAAMTPLASVHVSPYVVVVAGVTIWLPESALVPVHPPFAVHVVTFVPLHVSVTDVPAVTLVGLAESVTFGWVIPPIPVVYEYVRPFVRGSVLSDAEK
jgi:hypothetical protein